MLPTRASLIAIVSLAVVGSAGGAVNCVVDLYQEARACFSAQGIAFPAHAGQQSATIIMGEATQIDPNVQCRDKAAYKVAMNCTFALLAECLDGAMMGGALPHTDSYMRGLDFLCHGDRQQRYDGACVKRSYAAMTNCSNTEMKKLFEEIHHEQPDMEKVICHSSDIHYDCASKLLKDCANDTLDIYRIQLNDYQTPRVCEHQRPGRKRQAFVYTGAAPRPAPCRFAPALALGLAVLLARGPRG